MQIEQKFQVAADQQHVWDLIRDPEKMVGCIPGCESIEALGDDQYRATVVVSVGPVKAHFELTVDVVEESPPFRVKIEMRGNEGSRASLIDSTSDMNLQALPDGQTEVSYVTTVQISGRLGRYGSGMMLKLATRLGEQFQTDFCALAEA